MLPCPFVFDTDIKSIVSVVTTVTQLFVSVIFLFEVGVTAEPESTEQLCAWSQVAGRGLKLTLLKTVPGY